MISPLTREKWYPRALGVLVAGIAVVACGRGTAEFLPQGKDMLASLVSLGGILAGFLATMKTLLMGMKEETLGRLKSSGYMPYLKDYLGEALWSALALCGLAVIGFAPAVGHDNPLYLAALLGALVYSFASLYRVTRIGMGLLTQR